MKKTALVLGGAGFIGSHLIKDLKKRGYWVRSVDIKEPLYSLGIEGTKDGPDEFVLGDLRNPDVVEKVMRHPKQGFDLKWNPDSKYTFDEVYQLAADMGGAGFVFTGEHDADIMHNSALINLNVAKFAIIFQIKKLFYSSSACMYPENIQLQDSDGSLRESDAYPACPDSEYGWEKLFSERIYFAFRKNYNLDVRIARFHNIFGPEGSWDDGREKAPAAMCRKVAYAKLKGEDSIEIWGSGEQTRSFLFIDECLKFVRKLMDSEDYYGPVNIGSDERVSINQLAEYAMEIADHKVKLVHIDGPIGVANRNSQNDLIKEKLGSAPDYPLYDGLDITYRWILQKLTEKLTK